MDNLQIKRPLDAKKINIHEDWEVRYWCGALNVTPSQLRAAVQRVGVMVSDVKRFLGR